MGIDGFFALVQKEFPECIQKVTRGGEGADMDHLCVDVNNLLYIRPDLMTDQGVLNELWAEVEKIVFKYRPRKSVFLAMDGPGPSAKILTQRRRRMERFSKDKRTAGPEPSSKKQSSSSSSSSSSSVPMEDEEEEEDEGVDEDELPKVPGKLSSVQFTPGTEVLDRIKQSLILLCSGLAQLPQFSHLKFVISGEDSAGEGEYKIINYVNSIMDQPLNPQEPPPSISIYGGDSDLILFCLRFYTELDVHDKFEGLNSFRKNNKEVPVFEVIRRETGWKHSVIHVERLHDNIIEKIVSLNEEQTDKDAIKLSSLTSPQRSKIFNSIILDFVGFSTFLGNDYFPKVRYFNFMGSFNNYVRHRSTNINDSIFSLSSDRDAVQSLRERLSLNSIPLDDLVLPHSQLHINFSTLQKVVHGSISDHPVTQEAKTRALKIPRGGEDLVHKTVFTIQELVDEAIERIERPLFPCLEVSPQAELKTMCTRMNPPLKLVINSYQVEDPNEIAGIPDLSKAFEKLSIFCTTITIQDGIISQGYGLNKSKVANDAAHDALHKLKDLSFPDHPQFSKNQFPQLNSQFDLPNHPTAQEIPHQLLTFYQSVGWVLNYLRGSCLDYNLTFPYAIAPSAGRLSSLPDIKQALSLVDGDETEKQKRDLQNGTVTFPLTTEINPPFLPAICAMVLMPPPVCSKLMPHPIPEIVSENSPVARLFYGHSSRLWSFHSRVYLDSLSNALFEKLQESDQEAVSQNARLWSFQPSYVVMNKRFAPRPSSAPPRGLPRDPPKFPLKLDKGSISPYISNIFMTFCKRKRLSYDTRHVASTVVFLANFVPLASGHWLTKKVTANWLLRRQFDIPFNPFQRF